MGNIIYKGRIDGEFHGFDGDAIFKMDNGSYWHQVAYRYWYNYAYRPEAIVTGGFGRYVLEVGGEEVAVEPIDVIESVIDGTFDGWDGSKVYKLANGQVWQEDKYQYKYRHAYRPSVVVAKLRGAHYMFVKGTKARVRRVG